MRLEPNQETLPSGMPTGWRASGILTIGLMVFAAAVTAAMLMPRPASIRAQSVVMPDLSTMNELRWEDQYFTLGEDGNAKIALSLEGQDWTGRADFRVKAWQWQPALILEAQVPITVPREAMLDFRRTLQEAPLVERLPEPTGTAVPDVYTSFEMDVVGPRGQLARISSQTSTFRRWHRSPWVVEFEGRQAFTSDESVDQALGFIAEYLGYETYDRLREQAQNPSLLTPSPEPVGSILLPMLVRQH